MRRWAEYDIASQLNPGLASTHFEAAKALSAKGDTGAAAERARRGLELEPQSFYGRYTLGVVLQKAGQWPEAFVEFERAVALNGSDPRARANLASTALRTNRVEVARHAVRSNDRHGLPGRAGANFNLGLMAARNGDRAEAERRYKLALQADPTFKPARDALAKLK